MGLYSTIPSLTQSIASMGINSQWYGKLLKLSVRANPNGSGKTATYCGGQQLWLACLGHFCSLFFETYF